MSVHDQAYVISAAHYQETSALVKLLTMQHGIVSAVVRGVHGPGKKSSALRAALQLGNLVECQWNGKTSLKIVYQLELVNAACLNTAGQFVCLAYVHELLLYFLRDDLPVEEIFPLYHAVLAGFAAGEVEYTLRSFELGLLDRMGYGMDLAWDTGTDAPVQPELFYQLVPGTGFRLSVAHDQSAFPGNHLLSIQAHFYNDPDVLRSAKKLTRLLLAFHMEGKPIKARAMYRELFG